MAAVQSFYASQVAELTRQLDAKSAAAEQSAVALKAVRADFDLFRSLEEARVSPVVAHALSVERTGREELASKLA